MSSTSTGSGELVSQGKHTKSWENVPEEKPHVARAFGRFHCFLSIADMFPSSLGIENSLFHTGS